MVAQTLSAASRSITPEGPIESYYRSKWGYLCVKLVQNPFLIIISGYLLTSDRNKNARRWCARPWLSIAHLTNSRTSTLIRYDGCNVKQQLFAHLFGSFLFPLSWRNQQTSSLVQISQDGCWLRANGLVHSIATGVGYPWGYVWRVWTILLIFFRTPLETCYI